MNYKKILIILGVLTTLVVVLYFIIPEKKSVDSPERIISIAYTCETGSRLTAKFLSTNELQMTTDDGIVHMMYRNATAMPIESYNDGKYYALTSPYGRDNQVILTWGIDDPNGKTGSTICHPHQEF